MTSGKKPASLWATALRRTRTDLEDFVSYGFGWVAKLYLSALMWLPMAVVFAGMLLSVLLIFTTLSVLYAWLASVLFTTPLFVAVAVAGAASVERRLDDKYYSQGRYETDNWEDGYE